MAIHNNVLCMDAYTIHMNTACDFPEKTFEGQRNSKWYS